ncbi:MAG: HPF/RaiA family ribosome-associated protein [Gemmatimonadota bacterium]
MKLPLQVTFQDLTPSPALETAVRERAAKLDHFHPHLLSCRVVVSHETRRRKQGNEFSVRFDIKAKGHEIAITRTADEDPFVALRDAFDAAKRQLEELARAQRGEVKTHSR